MAGERMWIGDHREVSAVCTHPEAQGRGYARALMAHGHQPDAAPPARRRSCTCEGGNERAIRTYEGLGFVRRAGFPLSYARRMR